MAKNFNFLVGSTQLKLIINLSIKLSKHSLGQKVRRIFNSMPRSKTAARTLIQRKFIGEKSSAFFSSQAFLKN